MEAGANTAGSLDVEILRVQGRYDLGRRALLVLQVAALYFPVTGAVPIADALAGKTTSVTLTVSVTIALLGSTLLGLWQLWNKSQKQRGVIETLRGRCTQLERELNEAKGA